MKKQLYFFMTLLALLSCQKSDNTPLIADFESDAVTVEMGQKIVFKDLSSGDPTRWNWTFEGGDPEESILFSPEVVYNQPGTYTVSLAVRRSDYENKITKEKYITVTYPTVVTADFSADKTSAINGEEVAFKDLSKGAPNKWTWTFTSVDGEVLTSAEQNTVMIFSKPGLYSVKLVAENPETSGTAEKSDYITIIDKNAVYAGVSAVCRDTYAGGTVQFQDKTVGNVPDSWEWVFEGGTPATSTDRNPVVRYDVPGQYKVSLKVVKGEYKSEISIDKCINVIPSDGLVFYYPFDGNCNDAGPNSMNLESLQAGTTKVDFESVPHFEGTGAEGRFAAHFYGGSADNYSVLRVPDSGITENYDPKGDFSLSCWVKVDELPSGKKYAIYHQGSGPGMNPAGSRQSWFRITTDKKHVVFCVEYKGASGNWAEYQGEQQYDDGKWHHYVCIYKKNGSVRDSYIYIDGKIVAQSIGKVDKVIDAIPYYIGCNYRTTNSVFTPENFMNGCIDDYILYNRALSESEIQALYMAK